MSSECHLQENLGLKKKLINPPYDHGSGQNQAVDATSTAPTHPSGLNLFESQLSETSSPAASSKGMIEVGKCTGTHKFWNDDQRPHAITGSNRAIQVSARTKYQIATQSALRERHRRAEATSAEIHQRHIEWA